MENNDLVYADLSRRCDKINDITSGFLSGEQYAFTAGPSASVWTGSVYEGGRPECERKAASSYHPTISPTRIFDQRHMLRKGHGGLRPATGTIWAALGLGIKARVDRRYPGVMRSTAYIFVSASLVDFT